MRHNRKRAHFILRILRLMWYAALIPLLSGFVGPAVAQDSNSASIRIGYIDTGESGEDPGMWAGAADLYVNLTPRFGLGLELAMNRFERGELTDKYYTLVFLLRNRESWGRVRPYVSGGGGIYLFHGGTPEFRYAHAVPAMGPNSLRSGPPPRTLNAYVPDVGWNLGLGAEFDVLPEPFYLEGDLRGHLVLTSFNDPRWLVVSIGLGIDWVGKDPG